MRHELSRDDNVAAGVHFRQSIFEPTQTEIIFYTSEGLIIDTKVSQSIERIFLEKTLEE